jgi:hypothetical protein
MTEEQKLTKVAYALDAATDILNSGHGIIDKLRLTETVLGDLWGCTDRSAMNWKEGAVYDDGSCIYCAEEPPEG